MKLINHIVPGSTFTHTIILLSTYFSAFTTNIPLCSEICWHACWMLKLSIPAVSFHTPPKFCNTPALHNMPCFGDVLSSWMPRVFDGTKKRLDTRHNHRKWKGITCILQYDAFRKWQTRARCATVSSTKRLENNDDEVLRTVQNQKRGKILTWIFLLLEQRICNIFQASTWSTCRRDSVLGRVSCVHRTRGNTCSLFQSRKQWEAHSILCDEVKFHPKMPALKLLLLWHYELQECVWKSKRRAGEAERDG